MTRGSDPSRDRKGAFSQEADYTPNPRITPNATPVMIIPAHVITTADATGR